MSATAFPRLAARLGLIAAALVAGCAAPPAPPPVARKVPTDEHRLPAGAAKALAEWFPDRHVTANSSGPLQQGGPNDLAVVLARGEPNPDYVLAVLEPAGKDEWRVATASHPISPGCAKCSVSMDLAGGGLYVRVIRAVGPDFANYTYRFTWPQGAPALTLTGVTAYVPTTTTDALPHSFSASVDMTTGKRNDVIEDVQDGTPVHRERQTSVPVRPPIAFAEFSFTADALDAETRKLPQAPFDPTFTLPPMAVALLRDRFPTMTLQSQASGVLKGDGARDLAVVLAPADRVARAGAASDTVVAVLLGQADGGWRLADVSGALAHDCTTCNVEVQIGRRVLTIQTTQVDAASSRTVDWQFAFRPKEASLRLVAVRSESIQRTPEGDGGKLIASVNLVNGDRVEQREDLVHGRRNRSEQRKRVAVRDPIPLAGFAFDTARLGDEPLPNLAERPEETRPAAGAAAASAPQRLSGS